MHLIDFDTIEAKKNNNNNNNDSSSSSSLPQAKFVLMVKTLQRCYGAEEQLDTALWGETLKQLNTVASYVAENDIDAAPLAPVEAGDNNGGIILVPEDYQEPQNNTAYSRPLLLAIAMTVVGIVSIAF